MYIQAVSFQLYHSFHLSNKYKILHQGKQSMKKQSINRNPRTQSHKTPYTETIKTTNPESQSTRAHTSSLAWTAYKTPPRNGGELRDTSAGDKKYVVFRGGVEISDRPSGEDSVR